MHVREGQSGASQSGLAAGVHVVGRSATTTAAAAAARRAATARWNAAATTARTYALTATGVKRRVKQVLVNLLSNALKFTPKGGRIDVGARLHDHVAEVARRSRGICAS